MWNKIIGQERAKEVLQRAITTNQIAHAYCFWGNDGVGKDALALAFAATVNCHSPIKDKETIQACGTCKSCVQALTLQHPNISFIFSLPSGKTSSKIDESPFLKLTDDQISAIQQQLALKAANPYHNITLQKATQIRISSIRDIKRTIHLSQSQVGRRVIIISEADEMTIEAANAFLKTLEEPNHNVTLIMTTSRKEQLPQTILSRCQQVYCDTLDDTSIAQALVQSSFLSEPDARLIASLSQGSYSRAIDLLGEDMKALRSTIVELLRAALKSGNYRLDIMHHIDELSRSHDKSSLEKMLLLLIVWLRDAYIFEQTGSAFAIVNSDHLSTIERFSNAFKNRSYPTAIYVIEQTISAINGNAQIQLSLIAMFVTLRRIFAGNIS